MRKKIMAFFLFLLVFGFFSASAQADNLDYSYYRKDTAQSYFVSSGFDTNGDGQPDVINTGTTKLFAIKWPLKGIFYENNQNVEKDLYLHSYIGGVTAPLAYYPDICGELTRAGMKLLVGNGTFEQPDVNSSLGFRSILYATDGKNALMAFYLKAVQLFPSQLPFLLQAEEFFRTALRVNPYYNDALNGLLEIYYARAEGFTLIGNDYLANAYKHKFERKQTDTKSVNEMEIEDISSALVCYETGFREFMKLFNPDFIGVGQERKPSLDINAEWLFFNRRFDSPNKNSGEKVSYESLRGQTSALGASSHAYNGKDVDNKDIPVGPIQGSPNIEIDIPLIAQNVSQEEKAAAERKKSLAQKRLSANNDEWNTVDAPVKFQLPVPAGAFTYKKGTDFSLRFDVDVAATNPIQKLGMVVEFDYTKLDIVKVDFAGSAFPNNQYTIKPNEYYGDVKLFANQLLVKAENGSPVSGTGLKFATVTFHIKVEAEGSFCAYAAGSGGQNLSGYKDVAILYRLAAAHANTTVEKIRRLYSVADQQSMQDNIALIDKEVGNVGSWFEHIQGLLSQAAKAEELSKIDRLQSAINQVSSELNGLNNLREFIRSGANVYGYRDDYVPFYNSGQVETFDAIKNLVVGAGAFTPKSAAGFFGTAREAETNAVLTKKEFADTKDRIRSELFTINDQLESRLVQLCGRVDKDGNPSVNINDAIDYDLSAAPRNIACEIGQNVLLLQRGQKVVEQAQADITQFLEDIELDEQALQKEIELKSEIPGILEEYSQLQQNKTREIAKVLSDQAQANALTQALSTMSTNAGWTDWISGKSGGAATAAIIQAANGIYQGEMERKKGELQAEKEGLAAQERIRLTAIDTEIFKIQATKDIEQKLNDVALKNITIQISAIDLQVALGHLNQFIAERDELLARRGRQIANLGEMSFADPSFRLTQFNAMKSAETQLEFLKGWLYLMTRSLYYRWALPEGMKIQVNNLPQISIDDINRIQVVGALDNGSLGTPLNDALTASDYVQALLLYNDTAPLRLGLSEVDINDGNSSHSSRYSLREDFLRIVRNDTSDAENQRLRDAFKAWLKAPERYDTNGNLVIAFDTLGHLENYNLAVNQDHGTWTNFALRSYNEKPLWNHKITKVGVALQAFGGGFIGGVTSVIGSLEYGGTGFVKRNTNESGDFMAFQMKQWLDQGSGRLEPVDVRTVSLSIPLSADFTEEKNMVANLAERPVASTLWRLKILKNQLVNINLDNIQDIWIYINSKAYQKQ